METVITTWHNTTLSMNIFNFEDTLWMSGLTETGAMLLLASGGLLFSVSVFFMSAAVRYLISH